jgi:hypothetical protein
LKIYNTLALRTLLYGRETWVIGEQDKSWETTAEMKFVKRTAKYTWQDYRTNEGMLSELNINPVVKFKMTKTKRHNLFGGWTDRLTATLSYEISTL